MVSRHSVEEGGRWGGIADVGVSVRAMHAIEF